MINIPAEVTALDTNAGSSDSADISEGASAAVAGFMVNAHALASVTLEALYKR